MALSYLRIDRKEGQGKFREAVEQLTFLVRFRIFFWTGSRPSPVPVPGVGASPEPDGVDFAALRSRA